MEPAQNPPPLPGRKRPRPDWYRHDFEEGTTLLVRDEARRQRALRKLDLKKFEANRQKEDRAYARYLWINDPGSLRHISIARH